MHEQELQNLREKFLGKTIIGITPNYHRQTMIGYVNIESVLIEFDDGSSIEIGINYWEEPITLDISLEVK